ncbi:hypothetical protein BDP27DRAFT_1234519 [Rhodocollybia butyracea]|uniref:Uncharacterized protein n=1 Tax=Rhodocollybia butyracea TaxID=206335 RepID=A0A9P5PEB2_9AGAR|nr:hypothetical protein BDP27DRAFT_1234519 [Rhodocollybia butyracea]
MYAEQQRLDSYEEAVVHAQKQKSLFDKKVLGSKGGQVEFQKGELVQYRFNQMDNTHSTKVKLAACWSTPVRIAGKLENSYELVWRNGTRVDGGPFHVRRICTFKANPGTELWREHVEIDRLKGSEGENNKTEDAVPAFG